MTWSSRVPFTARGEKAAHRALIRGRARNASMLPARTSKMPLTASMWLGQSTMTTGFTVCVRKVKYSISSRCSTGTSLAVAKVQTTSTSGVSS